MDGPFCCHCTASVLLVPNRDVCVCVCVWCAAHLKVTQEAVSVVSCASSEESLLVNACVSGQCVVS